MVLPEQKCKTCDGIGFVPTMTTVLMGYVSKDMATDACCPEMEGHEIWGETEVWAPCPECNKEGDKDEPEPEGNT